MNWQIISFPLIIIGVLLYSICQKSITKNANALLVIATAYFIALMISLVLLISKGEIKKELTLFSNQKWLPIILLGLSLPMIELGFLYAYRLGWKISTTSIITGSFTTIALALIGVLWYKEDLTLINIVGIVLSSIGVFLVNYK